jgi:hypothetical protein
MAKGTQNREQGLWNRRHTLTESVPKLETGVYNKHRFFTAFRISVC